MTILHQPHPNNVLRPDSYPGLQHSSIDRVAAAVLAESVEFADHAVPWISAHAFEPLPSERDEYVTYLLGDWVRMDLSKPWLERTAVNNRIGLDMPLLGIAQLSHSRTNMSDGNKYGVQRETEERLARTYIFEVPPERQPAGERHSPMIMLANGVHLAKLVAARATGRQGPVPGKNMPFIRYGETGTAGDSDEQFEVAVTKRGEVLVSDRSKHGTELIMPKGGKRAHALRLGASEPYRSPTAHHGRRS